jgi:hypothetical protein
VSLFSSGVADIVNAITLEPVIILELCVSETLIIIVPGAAKFMLDVANATSKFKTDESSIVKPAPPACI